MSFEIDLALAVMQMFPSPQMGKSFLYVNFLRPVAIWDVNRRLFLRIDRQVGYTDFTTAEISSDGNIVASAYENGKELFDTMSGKRLGAYKTSDG